MEIKQKVGNPLEEMATHRVPFGSSHWARSSIRDRVWHTDHVLSDRVWVWPINVLDGCSYRTLYWWQSVSVSGDLGSPVSGFHLRLRHMILDTAPVTLQFFPHWAFTPTHAFS